MRLRDNAHNSTAAGHSRQLFASLLSILLVFVVSACSPTPDNSDTTSASSSSVTNAGNVAIFTPSDGITLSQHTPLNKWTVFVSELTAALQEQHVQKKAISSNSYDNLDEQSRAIQDYVVNRVAQSASSSSTGSTAGAASNATSLIVAPVTETADFQRQFGDYFGTTLEQQSSSSSSTASSSSSSSSGSSTSDTSSSPTDSSSASSESSDEQQAITRLSSALNLAKKSGMHVVMLSSTLEGFTPDLYAPMSSVEQMAQVQAKQLVNKLELDSTSKENPKQIEIMLPSSSNASNAADEFDKAAFSAIWDVLGPYFRSGAVESPSGLLDGNSTADSWKSVSFQASDENSIKKELTQRLGKQSKSAAKRTRIDGILAMNDYVASEITTTLTSLGYTGSSADINPEISISGIVDNITGKTDLKKDKVPDPSVAPTSDEDADEDSAASSSDSSSDSSSSTSSTSDSSAWPIVTGYGAYLDNIPSIVDGQQWMTALEDRKTLATTIGKAVKMLNVKGSISGIDGITTRKSNGVTAPTVEVGLLTVSASNLKTTLIDTNYVTAADAGL